MTFEPLIFLKINMIHWNLHDVVLADIAQVVVDDGDDTFLMTSDFLAAGSQQWVTGPATPVEGVWDVRGPCSVAISEESFLVIGGLNIREYRVDLAKPTSNEGWQISTRWPDLQQNRAQQPGCARISGHWCLMNQFFLDFDLREGCQ